MKIVYENSPKRGENSIYKNKYNLLPLLKYTISKCVFLKSFKSSLWTFVCKSKNMLFFLSHFC